MPTWMTRLGDGRWGVMMAAILLLPAPLSADGAGGGKFSAGISCTAAGAAILLPGLGEASGVAASRQRPDILWTHNDSGGEPLIYGIDRAGSVRETVKVIGASVRDWEDIAVGPCERGSCIYVADIGDNKAVRKEIAIHRFPEPAAGAGDATAETFRASYPDGPRDAEAFFIDSRGQMFVVSKGDTGEVALYRFPSEWRVDQTMRLEQVGVSRRVTTPHKITGAAASPDGRWVVLRTHTSLLFYRSEELTQGSWREAGRVNLTSLGEPQGEGVTFGPDNEIDLVSEGGLKSRPGVLNRLSCTFRP
jgi:hypothetical protein